MSELFSNNEQLFLNAIEKLKGKIESSSYQTKEKQESAITEGQADIQDAESCLRQMEVELAVLNAQTKAELQPRVRKYRADYDNVRRQFMRLQEKYIQQKDKETLMGAQMEDPTGVHHNKLLNHQDMVMKQNFALEGAIRTGYEAGSVALDIERDLRDQNVRAVGSQGKLKNMQGMLGESDSIITRMLRREKLTKLALAGICAILVLALLIILYYKLFK